MRRLEMLGATGDHELGPAPALPADDDLLKTFVALYRVRLWVWRQSVFEMVEYRASDATASVPLCPLQVSGERSENWGTLKFEPLPKDGRRGHPTTSTTKRFELNEPPSEEEMPSPKNRAAFARLSEIAYLAEIRYESWKRHMLSSLDFSLYQAGWLAEKQANEDDINQVFSVPSLHPVPDQEDEHDMVHLHDHHHTSSAEGRPPRTEGNSSHYLRLPSSEEALIEEETEAQVTRQVLISFAPSGSALAADVSSAVRDDFQFKNALLAYPQDAAFPARDQEEFEGAVLEFAVNNLGFGDQTVEDIRLWQNVLRGEIDTMRAPEERRRLSSSAGGTGDQDEDGDHAGNGEDHVYFEKQRAGQCGLHALNHVIGYRHLQPPNMRQACEKVVRQLGDELGVCDERMAEHCGASGWYSHPVMIEAAQQSGEFRLGDGLTGAERWTKILDDDVLGLVVWTKPAGRPEHWIAVVPTTPAAGCPPEGTLWLLDSQDPDGPRQLSVQDYQRFLLRTNALVFPVLRLSAEGTPGTED